MESAVSSKDTQSAIWEVSMSTAVSTIPGDTALLDLIAPLDTSKTLF